MATEAHCTGGLFSVALSVAETSPRWRELHEESAPWRYQARCPTVSGLSSRPAFLRRLAQRSPGLPASFIIACIGNLRRDCPNSIFRNFVWNVQWKAYDEPQVRKKRLPTISLMGNHLTTQEDYWPHAMPNVRATRVRPGI